MAALIAMISIAYGAALGTWVGVVVAVGFTAITAVAVWRASAVISVSEDEIRAGRAVLPKTSVDSVRMASGADLAAIRRGQDPCVGATFYAVGPPWAPRVSVVVLLDDPADPHSSWLLPTRNPTRLAGAIAPPSPN